MTRILTPLLLATVLVGCMSLTSPSTSAVQGLLGPIDARVQALLVDGDVALKNSYRAQMTALAPLLTGDYVPAAEAAPRIDRICDIHDSLITQNVAYTAWEREQYLRSSDILREMFAAALE